MIQAMHSKRLGVGVAVVNRLLYAIGGFDGTERLSSMECYHPENNVWMVLPSMKTGRSGAGVAALNQYVYVVGGFDGHAQLSAVERYDTEQDIWEEVAPIRIARSALSLTVLDGKLFAMGGFDGQNFLSIVEVYDPAADRWEEGTQLTSGRSGHASAVIYQPACANLYMEGIEESGTERKNPPFDHEDDGSGPSNARPSNDQAPCSSNSLHSFTGTRCDHCDATQKTLSCNDFGLSNETGIQPAVRVESVSDEGEPNDVNANVCPEERRKLYKSNCRLINALIQRSQTRRSENRQCSFIELKRRFQRNITDLIGRAQSRAILVPPQSSLNSEPNTAAGLAPDHTNTRSNTTCNSTSKDRCRGDMTNS